MYSYTTQLNPQLICPVEPSWVEFIVELSWSGFLVLFILRPCQHDNGYIDGRSQIKVHTDERTQVHSSQPSLAVTHQGTNYEVPNNYKSKNILTQTFITSYFTEYNQSTNLTIHDVDNSSGVVVHNSLSHVLTTSLVQFEALAILTINAINKLHIKCVARNMSYNLFHSSPPVSSVWLLHVVNYCLLTYLLT